MLARALTFMALVLPLTACGVTGNFRHDPGYVDSDALQRLESDSRLALSFGPLPLRLAGWVLDEDDAEIESMIAELRGVRVHVFEGLRDADEVARGVEELQARLLGDGWHSVVSVRDGAERVSVLLRPGAEGTAHGAAVIIHEPNEVVLVNLIGNVRLDLMGGYMSELGVRIPATAIDAANVQAGTIRNRARPASGTDP
jgi:hypothetical protein